jgi:hypothetical protein
MSENFFKPPLLEIQTSEELEKILKELSANIQKTEIKVSEIQDAFNQLPVPCINQLRYAGYHLCQVISSSKLYEKPIKIDQNHLLSAYKHSLRAYYDALDFSSVLVSDAFSKIEKGFNDLLIPVQDHFPDYNVWRVEINSLSRLRALSEENALYENARDKTKRELYYKKLDNKIAIVIEIYQHLPLMAEKLSILAKQLKKDDGRYTLDISFKSAGFVLAILAVAVATLVFLFGNSFLNQS